MRPVWVGLLLALAALAGCQPAKTAEEACRRQNAWNRANVNYRGDASSRALEDMRCDEIGREERAEARQQAADEAVTKRESERLNRQTDAQLAAIRQAPKVPEIGATSREVEILCAQQRGQSEVVAGGSAIGCRVGGYAIFAAHLRNGQVDGLDAYFEGADLAHARENMTRVMGAPPDAEGVGQDGLRVFSWGGLLFVGMYDRGVRISRHREPVR